MAIATQDHYIVGRKKFLRVTALLERAGASDFSGIPDRDFYMARGKANHELFEHVERGVDAEHTYDPRVETYRAGHARFLRETGFRALPGGIELFVKATWAALGFAYDGEEAGVAGTLDRLGTIQSRVLLLDYKTTSVPKSTAAQTALYLLLLPGYKFHDVERRGVAFCNDGTYKMTDKYPYTDKADALGLIDKYLKETT